MTENEASKHPLTLAKPWHPAIIAIVTVICTPLPGGILHALNYSRLGLTSRVRSALISNLLLAALIILISVRASFMGRSSFQIKILAVFLTVAAAVYFYRSQIIQFRVLRNQGAKAGGWLAPSMTGVAFACLLFGLSLGLDHLWMKEFYRGVTLIETEQYSEAEKIFLKYQEQDPRMVEAAYNLAIIYSNSDRTDLARAQLQKVLRLDPTDEQAKELLHSLEINGGEQSPGGDLGPR